MSHINHVTTPGSGVLGGQIAWHSAFRGKTVVAGADLVIESIPEVLNVRTAR